MSVRARENVIKSAESGEISTHPKRFRKPNISMMTPKKGYLRNTSTMPAMNETAARESRQVEEVSPARP